MAMNRILATSKRMPRNVPVFNGLCRDCDRMGGRSVMQKPDDLVTEALECADQTICGHIAREFHAASTGISSSFT